MRPHWGFWPILGRHQAVLATWVRRFGEGGLPLFHHSFGSLLTPTSSGTIWKPLSSKCHCSRSLSSSFTYWLSLAHCFCCLEILSTAILLYFKAQLVVLLNTLINFPANSLFACLSTSYWAYDNILLLLFCQTHYFLQLWLPLSSIPFYSSVSCYIVLFL